MNFCSNCGTPLSKTSRCCPQCGKFLTELKSEENTETLLDALRALDEVIATAEEPIAYPTPAPVADGDIGLAPAAPVIDAFKAAPETADKPERVKAGKLMLLQLLFAIPVVGLTFAIVFASRKSTSAQTRALSKARIIWSIILVGLAVALFAVYELWMRSWMLSQGITGIRLFGTDFLFDKLTITNLF